MSISGNRSQEATQLDWLSTVVKAQNDFLTEVNAAYVSAARDVLK